MSSAGRSRTGHTLVELLVVISIAGVLLALLLAGVQAARESARNSVCRARLGQLAKALQLYEGQSQRGFPRRVDQLAGANQSWVVHTLPFMDQQATYDVFASGRNGERYIESLVCPSDPPLSQDDMGWLSFVGNCGGVVVETTRERLQANGVFHRQTGPKVSLDYLGHHDGSSYTLLLSENIQAGRWTQTSREMVGFVWHQGDGTPRYDPEVGGDTVSQSGNSESDSEGGEEGCVLNQAMIIDDGENGYTATGTWTATSGGWSGSCERASSGTDATATWTFANLAAGRYQISATWKSFSSCATNAAYVIEHNAESITAPVDQSDDPQADVIDSSVAFEVLAEGVDVAADGTLQISLDASTADGFVIADAVRVECVGSVQVDDSGDDAGSDEAIFFWINDDRNFEGLTDLEHARPSSHHNGGVNFGFCDGRVRFIQDTIHYRVYRQLMTPYGDGSDAIDDQGNHDPVLDVGTFGE